MNQWCFRLPTHLCVTRLHWGHSMFQQAFDISQLFPYIMMTSSNGNIFRVTGHLCGEFTGPAEFPTQMPVTRSFDVFFDLRLNKRLSKQPRGWWCEAQSWSLWRHCNVMPTNCGPYISHKGQSQGCTWAVLYVEAVQFIYGAAVKMLDEHPITISARY